MSALTTPVSPAAGSTSAVSRVKAFDGAYASYLAEQKAKALGKSTQKNIAVGSLYDEKLPQVKTSHAAFAEDCERGGTIETTTVNPLFTTGTAAQRPTYHGCPSSLSEDAFFSYAVNDIRSISLKPSPKTVMSTPEAQAATKAPAGTCNTTLTVEGALRLKVLLSDPNCRIEYLDCTGALDSFESPQPQPTAERLAEARAVVAAIYGEEETEEGAEKLQAEVDRLRGTYETYADGLTFLAAKRLERVGILTDAFVANKSLVEIRLGSNNFGAPNSDDGRSFYGPLNRLERFIDHNKTVKILDLSGNRAGPKGIGIVAKAMCKNISIHTLNLSANDLMLDETPEEEEDPQFEEDDAVFGEMYEALEALSEMVKKNKFLRSLSLRHNFIKPQDVNEDDEEDMGVDTPIMKFFEPFRKYHRIEVLDLSANELGDTGIRLLCSCLKENQSVRHLDISKNNITSKGLGYLATWVAGSEYIDTLIAQNNAFAPKVGTKSKKAIAACMTAAQSFADALAANKTLQILNLNGNHFGPEMSAVLLSSLSDAVGLTELQFENNELCSAVGGTDFVVSALAHICKALLRPGNTIASLNLSGNFIQYKGIFALTCGAEFLQTQTVVDSTSPVSASSSSPTILPSPSTVPMTGALRGLVSLNLSRNAIGDDGLTLLCKELTNGAVIVNLSIANNNISNPIPLVSVLRSPNVQLSSLDVSRNRIGGGVSDDTAVRAFGTFASAVTMSNSLQTIDLSFADLSDANGPALSAICRVPYSVLNALYLVGNPLISDGMVSMIIQELKTNTSLRTLRVTASSRGDHHELLQSLLSMLAVNRSLVDVDCGLNMTVAEEEGVATVQKVLLLNGLHLSPVASVVGELLHYSNGDGMPAVPNGSVNAL